MKTLLASVPGQSFVLRHADAEEYAVFVRQRLHRRDSVNRVLLASQRFVQRYPDLDAWFQLPLAERVGRLYGEEPGRLTSRVSYEARAYLYFLALRRYAQFDYPWLLAIRWPDFWAFLSYTELVIDVHSLVHEARRLGYSQCSSERIRPLVARLYLYMPIPCVADIGEAALDELGQAMHALGARPDRDLFFGTPERYGEAVRQCGSSLHLLHVVLYHRGQIATEPRTAQPRSAARALLKRRMATIVERYLATRRLTSRPRTVDGLTDSLQRFCLWLAREHPDVDSFAAVTRAQVLDYAAALDTTRGVRTDRVLAANTKRGLLSRLSIFFQDVAAWGWDDVPGHPLLGIGDLPKMPHRIPRYIPDDELTRLMGAVRALPCPYQRAALLIARSSGAAIRGSTLHRVEAPDHPVERGAFSPPRARAAQ